LEINPNLPNKAEIWSQTGLALANPGRYQEAVDAIDTSLSINPNSEVKSNKETVEAYTRNISATSTPTTMANDINQGLINEINRYKTILDRINKKVSLNPNDTVALKEKETVLYWIGFNSNLLNRTEESLDFYNQ
jgi:tetratricopeptide (TPR) repeat protein